MASARTVLFSFLVIHILNGTAGESNLSDDNLVPAKADGKTYYVDSYIPKSERLGTPQLIQHSGHEYEEFDVTTEDKYVLKLFHIKGNWSEDPPILLLHGVMDSSDTFLTRRKLSLAINLTESGYDVWLGNFRGNKYSRRHLDFDPNVDDKFWDYSFHENGFYDSPAMIDYVLNVTGKSQLIVVGHSQGTLNQFVTGSTRPEYNHKIKVFIALAPIFFTIHYKGIAALADIIPPLICMKHHLLPLETRREIADVIYFHKIIIGNIDCPELLALISLKVPRNNLRSCALIHIPVVSTNYCQNTYLLRASGYINSLVRDSDLDLIDSSVASIRRRLTNNFFNQ